MSAALLAALSCAASGAALAQSPYRLTIFGPGGDTSFFTNSVNNSGEVAGWDGGNFPGRAGTWDGVLYTPLGAGQAFGINNSGQVVGGTFSAAGYPNATLWDGSGARTLDIADSVAYDINDLGQAVGFAVRSGEPQATLWQGSSVTTLGPGFAYSINSAGQAVGHSLGGGAALWDANGLTLLGTPSSFAYDINARGQIVGYEGNRAHLWDGTTSIELGAVGSGLSFAFALNNLGQAVGQYQSDAGPGRAALWNGTIGTDLNSLLRPESVAAGWVLTGAFDVNDSGWIVGQAYNTLECPAFPCKEYGYLLSISDLPDRVIDVTAAIPEPSTYALMLAGLAVIGFVASRRRGAEAAQRKRAAMASK